MNKILISLVSIIILIAIGYGIYNATQPKPQSSPSPTATTTNNQAVTSPDDSSKQITNEELAKNNGKNGADCWVAVDGTVYDASGSDSFKDGVHVQSKGQTQCGQDESDSIGASPHGSEVLSKLPVIGTLTN